MSGAQRFLIPRVTAIPDPAPFRVRIDVASAPDAARVEVERSNDGVLWHTFVSLSPNSDGPVSVYDYTAPLNTRCWYRAFSAHWDTRGALMFDGYSQPVAATLRPPGGHVLKHAPTSLRPGQSGDWYPREAI